MGTKLTLKLYQLVRSCWWCDAVLRSQCVIAKYIWNISFTTSQEICVSTDQTKHYLNYLFWVPVHYLLFIMTFLHSHKSWGMKHCISKSGGGYTPHPPVFTPWRKSQKAGRRIPMQESLLKRFLWIWEQWILVSVQTYKLYWVFLEMFF